MRPVRKDPPPRAKEQAAKAGSLRDPRGGHRGRSLFPIASVIYLSLSTTASGIGLTLSNFRYIFTQTDVLTWLRNSLIVSVATTFFAVAIGASAGYVVSRARSKVVHWYSLGLFLLQSLPIVVFVIPLYIVFTRLALGNTLQGVVIIYVGGAIAVGTWIMAAYFDTIPKELEEAAWIDGCSVLGGYLRIVLVNSVPGLISTAIFSFLVAWNDYLVALIFLRSSGTYTLALGMQSFYNQFGQSVVLDYGGGRGNVAASGPRVQPAKSVFQPGWDRRCAIGDVAVRADSRP